MVDVVRGFIGLIIQIITSTTGLFLLNLGYLLFGSYVFYVLESPHEAQLVSDLADRRITLIQQLDALEKAAKAAPTDTTTAKDSTSDLKKNASIYLAQYEEKLADFYRKRAVLNINDESGSNATGQTKLWTPLGAIIYSYSVITTIGWGNIVPGTDNGKMVTIVYGIFGIPLLFALSTDTGNMVAAFNLKLWKLIHGIYRVMSRLLGIKKKEEEDEEDTDSDDNDNRKRNLIGSDDSGGGAGSNWNRPLDKASLTEAEKLDCLTISQRLTEKVQRVAGDVHKKTRYLRSTESTVDFLLDLALKTDESDFERTLQLMTPHRRILSHDDALQLVLEFDCMTLSEFRLCAELVGVSWETFSRFFFADDNAAVSRKASDGNVTEVNSGTFLDCKKLGSVLVPEDIETSMRHGGVVKPSILASPVVEHGAEQTLVVAQRGSDIVQSPERIMVQTHNHSPPNKTPEDDFTASRSESRLFHEAASDENISRLVQNEAKPCETAAKSRERTAENNDVTSEGAHALAPLNVVVSPKDKTLAERLAFRGGSILKEDNRREQPVGTGNGRLGGELESNIDARTKKLALIFSKVFEVEQLELVSRWTDGGGDGKGLAEKGRRKRAATARGRSTDTEISVDGRLSTVKRDAPVETDSHSVDSRSRSGAEGKTARGSDAGSGVRESHTTTSCSRSVAGSLVVEVGSRCGDGDSRKSESSGLRMTHPSKRRPCPIGHWEEIRRRHSESFNRDSENFNRDSENSNGSKELGEFVSNDYYYLCGEKGRNMASGEHQKVSRRKIDRFKSIDVLRISGLERDDTENDSINDENNDGKPRTFDSLVTDFGPGSSDKALSCSTLDNCLDIDGQADHSRLVGSGDTPSAEVNNCAVNGNNARDSSANEIRATSHVNGDRSGLAEGYGCAKGVNEMACSGFAFLHAKMSPYARNVKERERNYHCGVERVSGLDRVHSSGTIQSAAGQRNISQCSGPIGGQTTGCSMNHRNDHNANHRNDHNMNHRNDHNVNHRNDHNVNHRNDHNEYHRNDYHMNHRNDHNMNHRNDHNMNHRNGHSVNHRTDHNVNYINVHNINHTNDHSIKHNTDHGVKLKADHKVNRTLDHNINHNGDHKVNKTTEYILYQRTDHLCGQREDVDMYTNGNYNINKGTELLMNQRANQMTNPNAYLKTDHVIRKGSDINKIVMVDHCHNENKTDNNKNKTDHNDNQRTDYNEKQITDHKENRRTDHNENRRTDHNENITDHNKNQKNGYNKNQGTDHNENRTGHGDNHRTDYNENQRTDHNENRETDHNVNFKDFFDDADDDDDAASIPSMSEVSDDFSMYSEDDGDSAAKDKSGGGGGKGGENNLPLSVLYLFVIMYILAGSFVYHHFSLDKESQIQNWVYFIYVTLSTTGFGDILPEEHMLLFTAIYGLLGMAIFNILLNATLETFLYAIDYINAFNVGAEDDDGGSDES